MDQGIHYESESQEEYSSHSDHEHVNVIQHHPAAQQQQQRQQRQHQEQQPQDVSTAMDEWLGIIDHNNNNNSFDEYIEPYEPTLVKLLRSGQWIDAINRLQQHAHEALWSSRESGSILHVAIDQTSLDDAGNIQFIPMKTLYKLLQNCDIHGVCTSILIREHHGRNILQVLLDDWELYHPLNTLVATPTTPNTDQEQLEDLTSTVELMSKLISMNPKIVNRRVASSLILNVWPLTRQLVPNFIQQCNHVMNHSINITQITSSSSGHLYYMLKITDMILYAWQYQSIRPNSEPPFSNFLHGTMALMDEIISTPTYIYELAIHVCTSSRFYKWDVLGRTPLSIVIGTTPVLHVIKNRVIQLLCTNMPGCSRLRVETLESRLIQQSVILYPSSSNNTTTASAAATTTTITSCTTSPTSNNNNSNNISNSISNTTTTSMVPLHLAIQEYSPSVDTYLPHLIADAPQSLSTREQSTRLYPFMYAAHYSKLDLCFWLLQQNPMLASGLRHDPLWKRLEYMTKWKEDFRMENEDLRLKVEGQEVEMGRLREELAVMKRQLDGRKEDVNNETFVGAKDSSCTAATTIATTVATTTNTTVHRGKRKRCFK